MIKTFFLIFFIGLPKQLSAADRDLQRLTLPLGESLKLSLPKASVLRLSQKQIVEVENLAADEIRIIALRSGLVYLRAMSQQGGLLKSWIVDVPSRQSTEKIRILDQEPWQQFYCREAGITCDKQKFLISGVSSSISWLLKARHQCDATPPCRFEVQLSDKARQALALTMQKELLSSQVSVLGDASVQVRVNCEDVSEAERDRWRNRLSEQYKMPVHIFCRAFDTALFEIEVLAIAERNRDADLDNPLHWQLLSLPPRAPVRAVLEGLSETAHLKIIAQPRALVFAGGEIKIFDGGELSSVNMGTQGMEQQWKAFGFQLHCKLGQKQSDGMPLRLKMTMSRPQGDGHRLDHSGIETEFKTEVGRWNLVGRMDTKNLDRQESHIPWLADIPLLGRLFTWELKSEGQNQLVLYLRLNEAKGDAMLQAPVAG